MTVVESEFIPSWYKMIMRHCRSNLTIIPTTSAPSKWVTRKKYFVCNSLVHPMTMMTITSRVITMTADIS